MRRIAYFDVDDTTVPGGNGGLLMLLFKAAARAKLIPNETYYGERAVKAWQEWKAGKATQHAYCMTIYDAFIAHDGFKGVYMNDLRRLAEELKDRHGDMGFNFPNALIKATRSCGYVTAAISGSPTFVIESLLRDRFDWIAGTEWEMNEDGMLLSGNPIKCPIDDKRQAAREAKQALNAGKEGSIAIGDSTSDIPMLEEAKFPIAFNPVHTLRETARQHQWLIVFEDAAHRDMTFLRAEYPNGRLVEVSFKNYLPVEVVEALHPLLP